MILTMIVVNVHIGMNHQDCQAAVEVAAELVAVHLVDHLIDHPVEIVDPEHRQVDHLVDHPVEIVDPEHHQVDHLVEDLDPHHLVHGPAMMIAFNTRTR
jgi:hypothetical protein